MIYLDNSATTKQHPDVTKEMIRCMEDIPGNPSSLHRVGLEAERTIKEARGRIHDAMDLPGGRILFCSGGTEADNMALICGARALKRRGRRIVTTAVEHPAVLETLRYLEREEGFQIVEIGVDRSGRLDMEALRAAVNEDTILVSIMQVNNEVGTIMPVDEAAEIIADKNSPALLHSDSVQSFCKIPLPKRADMISVSGHKIHGPKGSGALWIRDGLKLPALIHGGGQEKGLRSGTENVPGYAGLGVAAMTEAAEMKDSFARAGEIRRHLLNGLRSQIDDVVLNGPEETGREAGMSSPYILNVSFLGTRGEVILHSLEQEGVYVSTGSACSSNKKGRSHVLKAMGCDEKESESAIRFSFSSMTTLEEIEEAACKTADAVKRFRSLGSFR